MGTTPQHQNYALTYANEHIGLKVLREAGNED